MPVSNSATLHHTSIVVSDIEKSAEKLARTLSVTWNIWTITPDHCFVNGEPSAFSFKAAFAQVGIITLVLHTQIWKVCKLPKMSYKSVVRRH